MSDAITFLIAPAVLTILLVGIHAYLGLHVLERGVVFVDIGLSQVASLGATVSLFFVEEEGGWISMSLSIFFCVMTAIALALLRKFERKISQEVLVGLTYALASGLLILVADKLPHGTEHLKHAMVGNLLFVTWPQIFQTAAVYGVVGLIHGIYHRQFWASSRGHQGGFLWDFLFYVLFGIVITFSTHHAGVLVVFSILVAPAALAIRFFKRTKVQLLSAWTMGSVAVILGFTASYFWDWPTGAGIVAVVTAGFFAVLGATHLLELFSARA
ncbi:MAG: metal ABC transporter permease [Bdellovibrionales bacterium]